MKETWILRDESTSQLNLFKDLEQNIKKIQTIFGESNDLLVRKIHVGQRSVSCAFMFIDGLVKTQSITYLIDSLIFKGNTMLDNKPDVWEDIAQVGGSTKKIKDFKAMASALLSGHTLFLVDQQAVAYDISTEGWETRGIEESGTESVIRGPRESFTENLRTNTAMIRRRIKDPQLRMKSSILGRVTQTNVTLVYMEGIVNKKALGEIEKRLKQIDIDAVLESGYIEELIQDKRLNVFPTFFSTERPDVTAAGILEGRIAILVDGTPFIILAPTLFVQFFQAAEDYYLSPLYSFIARFLRYASFFILLFATSIYVASISYHQELIPTQLLISFAVQRENVPFPVFIEALLLMGTYEILREAIIRMPKAVGSAVSIVGALVLGDAAIEAGFVSSALVIVVAIEAVASFILPTSISTPVRFIRFGVVAMAATFGLIGIYLSFMVLLIYLCSLESFGVSYMSPLTPFNASDQKDTFIRFPLSLLRTRPSAIVMKNRSRQKEKGDGQ